MIAVVVSRADRASEHIGERLLDIGNWTEHEDDSRPDGAGGGSYYRAEGFELRTFDDPHLELDGVADVFDDPDLLLFASKHAGDTGHLLTSHPTGNFGPAEFGGDDYALARAAPNAQAAILDAFERYAPDAYDTGMECTHHGPTTVGCPSLFVELGSGERQWEDPAGAEAVARAILDCRGVDPDRERSLAGFGGGHYVPRFERVVRETDWAVGHVAADWGLHDMGSPDHHRDVVEQAFVQSNAEHALVEGDREDLEAVVEDLGYRVVSETWVRETTGVPLSLVERVETDLATVDEGLRFGAPATGYEGDVVVTDLPAELLEEAVGIDREGVREAVHETALGYVTAEGGTRVTGALALADPEDRDAIVDALASVLDGKYDDVERREDTVIARREVFDPEKARTLGVSEGPAFGKLSAGQAVEVNGRTIEPEVVRTAREERFPL